MKPNLDKMYSEFIEAYKNAENQLGMYLKISISSLVSNEIIDFEECIIYC